ncbi:hypothetical protein BK026_16335 [Alteromonas sp. V450]|nr:hypothetical protein BK026_16335 [Alteromonas sp. V450]
MVHFYAKKLIINLCGCGLYKIKAFIFQYFNFNFCIFFTEPYMGIIFALSSSKIKTDRKTNYNKFEF